MAAVTEQSPEQVEVDPGKPSLCLYRPMIRTPWKLSRAKRQAVVDRVFQIVMTGKPLESLAAIRLMLEMDRINLARLKTRIDESVPPREHS
jgi:hypothetical protein